MEFFSWNHLKNVMQEKVTAGAFLGGFHVIISHYKSIVLKIQIDTKLILVSIYRVFNSVPRSPFKRIVLVPLDNAVQEVPTFHAQYWVMVCRLRCFRSSLCMLGFKPVLLMLRTPLHRQHGWVANRHKIIISSKKFNRQSNQSEHHKSTQASSHIFGDGRHTKRRKNILDNSSSQFRYSSYCQQNVNKAKAHILAHKTYIQATLCLSWPHHFYPPNNLK